MRKGRSTGNPTKAQQARFEAIRDVGCVACRQVGLIGVACEVHHLTVGGRHGQKRRGHDFTVGLCEFHHRGSPTQLPFDLGPSYAQAPRAFRERFGDDAALLDMQNQLIGDTTMKLNSESLPKTRRRA